MSQQQMTRMDQVKPGDVIYKEGVLWNVLAVTEPKGERDQVVITADLIENDLSNKHIPVGYRKGMSFGGFPDTKFSVSLK